MIQLFLVLLVCGYGAHTSIAEVALEVNGLSAESKHKLQSVCSAQGTARVLVTGAAGFIGMHASLALHKKLYSVVGIDNFNAYYPVSLKLAREEVLSMSGIPVVRADICDGPLLREMFEICDFTHVLHLAAQAGVRYAFRQPYAYINSNVLGSVTILETMRRRPVIPVLVYASSSSVYGLSKQLPFSEMDRADTPASLYAATKRSQELVTHSYFNCFGISSTGLRFFTVYGTYGRPDMAVMSFTASMLKNKSITVFLGPSNQTLSRDFTHVEDVVQGILGSIESAPPSSAATATYRIFNLGNTRVTNVMDMIHELEAVTNRSARIRFIYRPNAGEVLSTNADISAARGAFGYNPSMSLSHGLRNFYDWYSQYEKRTVPVDMLKYIPDR